VTRWVELRGLIDKARSERKKDWLGALTVLVKRAAEARVCETFEQYRIKKHGRTITLSPRDGGAIMKTRKAEVPAIALRNLPALDDTKLSFRVVLQRDEKMIAEYTASAVGREKSSGRSWYVRVDLDAEQKGDGPCTHAMLHCHVGVDPAEEGGQESRTPLPWLDPDEALAWILATLHPHMEPR